MTQKPVSDELTVQDLVIKLSAIATLTTKYYGEIRRFKELERLYAETSEYATAQRMREQAEIYERICNNLDDILRGN